MSMLPGSVILRVTVTAATNIDPDAVVRALHRDFEDGRFLRLVNAIVALVFFSPEPSASEASRTSPIPSDTVASDAGRAQPTPLPTLPPSLFPSTSPTLVPTGVPSPRENKCAGVYCSGHGRCADKRIGACQCEPGWSVVADCSAPSIAVVVGPPASECSGEATSIVSVNMTRTYSCVRRPLAQLSLVAATTPAADVRCPLVAASASGFPLRPSSTIAIYGRDDAGNRTQNFTLVGPSVQPESNDDLQARLVFRV